MRIIFSRDRPAQLDLLLRSLDRNAPVEDTAVICRLGESGAAYGALSKERADVFCHIEIGAHGFARSLRNALSEAGDTVTFFCDDDVLYRPVPSMGAELLARDPSVLAFSLRLGYGNAQMPMPSMRRGEDVPVWDWARLPRHDFGYPASIDGHTFRTTDVFRMLVGKRPENPTMLETVMRMRCDSMYGFSRPMMACYPGQALVGIDVNRVSDQSGVRRRATVHPQPVRELNGRFVRGERIDLDAMDFTGVDATHVELAYPWHAPVPA